MLTFLISMKIFKKEDWNCKKLFFSPLQSQILLSINCEEKTKSLRSEGNAINHLTEWRVNGGFWRTVQTLLNGMDIKAIQLRPMYAISHPIVLLTR